MSGDELDRILGFCPQTWYVDDDMVDGGCAGNQGASHLCGLATDHEELHRCQDCDSTRGPAKYVPASEVSDEARIAWARVNYALDEHGAGPEYDAAWREFAAITEADTRRYRHVHYGEPL